MSGGPLIPIPDADELYRRAVRQKSHTLRVMKAKRHVGEKRSRVVPYGEDLVGEKLVKNPHEQAGIALMRKLREDGFSFRRIASELLRAGYSPKYGGAKWQPTTVLFILRRMDRLDRERGVK